MKFRAIFTLLFIAAVAISIPTASFSSPAVVSEKENQQRETKAIERLVPYIRCLSYFELTIIARREDPRIKSRYLLGALKILHTMILGDIRRHGIPKTKYSNIKNDIDTVMYSRINREIRKIGILVDDYDASCRAFSRPN